MTNLPQVHPKLASPPAARALLLTASSDRQRKNRRRPSRAKARLRSTELPDREEILASLSEQQWAVARLVAQGLTNPDIAERLHLSPHTVRNYLSRVMGRLGVHNRTAVAVILTQLQSQPPAATLVGAEKRAPLAYKPQPQPVRAYGPLATGG